MYNALTKTIPAQTCPEAWVATAEHLLSQPKHEAYYLTLAIESPEKMRPSDFNVHDHVEAFLRSYSKAPIATVAGTIFPANYYSREGAKGVFEDFPETFGKIRRRSGGPFYAMRMLRREGKEGMINPLKDLVEKLSNNKKHFRSAYEVSVAEDDSFELPLYQVEKDRRLLRRQPCLSHLSFKVYVDGSLTLAAMYRSHYYISKAFGNLIGLAQLQSFVAAEAGLKVGPLICYSTHARIDTNPWKISDIRKLISTCRATLSD
jgi:thymidylate synthase